MSTDREPIDGEYTETEPRKAVATRADSQAVIYNPLDAEPVAFANQLQRRQANYDALALHLRGILVYGQDFGRIHVAKNCENKWSCEIAGHYSDHTLFAPGADKILGVLGLGVHYPDLQDYKRAVLKGYEIQEVIADAQILSHANQVIAEGAGACARKEVSDNLNNCIKKACKRARLDAVKRLPVVSALFESDFLAELEAEQKAGRVNSTTGRSRKMSNVWDTGARLEVCPITREHKNKPWREVPTDTLEWIVAKVTDKPDVVRAAVEELTKRKPSASGSSSQRTQPSPGFSSAEEEYLNGQD